MRSQRITLYVFTLLALMLGSVSAAVTYKVKPSDTPYSIAKRHGVSVDQLMRVNKIKDPRTLRIGRRLTIPAKTVRPSKKRPTSKKKTVTPSKKKTRKPTRKSLRIIVDAGHGGKDLGASWYGVNESDLNLRVARKVESGLKARGYRVVMTRRSDVFLSLSRRAHIANRYRNALLVSIHFNATRNTSVRGAETFYAGGKRSYFLASAIQKQLVRRLKLVNRGARVGRYTVLTASRCPAVLVECGFISNSSERARCKTAWYQTAAAQAIVTGIEKYDRVY